MSEDNQRARVGIRELRQNLSVYVDRVKEGETLEVTEHGRPVAELRPLRRPSKSLVEEMIEDGRITPATRSIAEIPPPVPLKQGAEPPSAILLRMREEERY
jgi:prevent-host-death family protein